jgi:hypothetical protein
LAEAKAPQPIPEVYDGALNVAAAKMKAEFNAENIAQ